MNSKCKRTTLKNRNKYFTARKTYSKQLDCQCPTFLSGKIYVKCVKESRLKRRKTKQKKGGILREP
jgi:hypothetical protein